VLMDLTGAVAGAHSVAGGWPGDVSRVSRVTLPPNCRPTVVDQVLSATSVYAKSRKDSSVSVWMSAFGGKTGTTDEDDD
jgi:hypothetical protein